MFSSSEHFRCLVLLFGIICFCNFEEEKRIGYPNNVKSGNDVGDFDIGKLGLKQLKCVGILEKK
jgi:hypothetical protein